MWCEVQGLKLQKISQVIGHPRSYASYIPCQGELFVSFSDPNTKKSFPPRLRLKNRTRVMLKCRDCTWLSRKVQSAGAKRKKPEGRSRKVERRPKSEIRKPNR